MSKALPIISRVSVAKTRSPSVTPAAARISAVHRDWRTIVLRISLGGRFGGHCLLLLGQHLPVDLVITLLFGLRIEEADLSAIPAFLRDVLVARVNEALEKADDRIAWRFMDTLDFSFFLPREVLPLTQLRVYARSGAVQVEADALRLSIEWGLSASADRSDALP